MDTMDKTNTTINAGLGVAIAAAMYLLDMPYPFVWGIAAFCLNFLPFLGGVIGTLGVGAFAIVHFDSIYYAMLVPIAYQSLTALEGQFLTPLLLGVTRHGLRAMTRGRSRRDQMMKPAQITATPSHIARRLLVPV